MKFLIDQSSLRIADMQRRHADLVGGQLITPLTAFANEPSGLFAIDNGAYSRCDMAQFRRIVEREQVNRSRCLFVALPDIVGSARRTLEVFDRIYPQLATWPLALVCQDGQESLPLPWDLVSAVFIGGTTTWKMSDHVKHIIKAAQILGKHVHVGRVNTPGRFQHFQDLGVDTCDGSGVSRYDWMLDRIAEAQAQPRHPLLMEEDDNVVEVRV